MSIKNNCDQESNNYCCRCRIHYSKQEQSQKRKQRCCDEVLPQLNVADVDMVNVDSVQLHESQLSSVLAFRSRQQNHAENYFNIDSKTDSTGTTCSEDSMNLCSINVNDIEECCVLRNNRQCVKRKIIAHNFSCNRNYEHKNNSTFVNISKTAPILLQHQQSQLINLFLIMLLFLSRTSSCQGLLVVDPKFVGLPSVGDSSNILNNTRIGIKSSLRNGLSSISNVGSSSLSSSAVSSNGGGHYLDKLDNLERSVASVLIKVAYGTTSTTKRRIPDNSYVPSLTTIATHPLTTLRSLERYPHQTQINFHHQNYELDLERDHALPTSAPNNSSNSSLSSSSIAAVGAAHATWAVAWNIHVYLSVILFTILGVYSFYKMLTYNKLTHLFAQSYFVCIHIILIVICAARIFYLYYDAYNSHSTFDIFVSEILLNLPATFLTISFSFLLLFLILKSLNHKKNRYSALIRPVTVMVGCGVHVVLCIALHYVESYTMQNHQQHLYYQQQFYRQRQQAQQYAAAAASSDISTSNVHAPVGPAAPYIHHTYTTTVPTPPPRVLSLICQIIYIFICLSLGLLYLYIYRILKRILRSKSQNYIHGFQNLSYAIHITIATALLFVLLAALQIFGAISISITRPLIMQATTEMDWLQWGYQFSLRLIEIAIIALMSWVASLKTSGGSLDAVVGDNSPKIGVGVGSGGTSGVFGSTSKTVGNSEKHIHHHHTKVAQ